MRAGVLRAIDAACFVIAGLAALWLADLLLRASIRPGWPLLLLVVFWLLVTYLVLPRLHRMLTYLYVPGYFIGRARTSDGLLGDPVNLGLLGSEAQVHRALSSAGWTRADDLTLATGWRIVRSTLTRRSYPEAPVSPLHLFDRQQDFAYQQEVAGSPSRRHHVRFWRCPPGWLLPGGSRADWLAAGTYDRSVGLSLFTLQITHKIEQNTDVERDHVVSTVTAARPEVEVRLIRNFSTGYHSRNGGGDLIQTDGDLPILDLRPVAVEEIAPVALTDSRDKRPAQVVFGAGVAVVRGLLLIAVGVLLAVLPMSTIVELSGEPNERWALVVGGAVVVLLGAWDIGLGWAAFTGRTWARLLLLLYSVATTVAAFIGNASRSEVITLTSNLPTVGLNILVLLALSSHEARDYAARGRHLPKHISGRPDRPTVI